MTAYFEVAKVIMVNCSKPKDIVVNLARAACNSFHVNRNTHITKLTVIKMSSKFV